MAESRNARIGRRRTLLNWRTLVLGTAVVAIAGCFPYGGDGAADMRAHRKKMQATSEQYERGTRLAGQTLVAALSGRTLVLRYGSSSDGRGRDHVDYRYFRPDGRFVYFDTMLELDSSWKVRKGDYWKVTGPRLCTTRKFYTTEPECFQVARTNDGAFQLYVDDPGGAYHGLLTAVTREVIEGPPPS